jgi:propionyl-CoA carboxylase alpha chain
MNTRLQVEHPVTECVTGLDLVELQIQVAGGGRLGPEPPVAQGHSIEARLYAEDPARNWQPQAGILHAFAVTNEQAAFAPLVRAGVRVDSGVVDGSVVSVHYDPMLAKVISFASTRHQAAALLADALARARIHGVRTNRDLLVNVLRHPAFLAGNTDTAFFDTHDLTSLSRPLADADTVRRSALAAALAEAAHNRATARVFGAIPSGWRNLASGFQAKTYTDDAGAEHQVRYRFGRGGVHVPDAGDVAMVSATPEQVVLRVDGVDKSFGVACYGDDVFVDSADGPVHLTVMPRFPEPGSSLQPGSLVAPMPGAVSRVGAEVGDNVKAGLPIVWMEAMKMEHAVTAPKDGVVVELNVEVGQQVELGAVLARVEPADASSKENS